LQFLLLDQKPLLLPLALKRSPSLMDAPPSLILDVPLGFCMDIPPGFTEAHRQLPSAISSVGSETFASTTRTEFFTHGVAIDEGVSRYACVLVEAYVWVPSAPHGTSKSSLAAAMPTTSEKSEVVEVEAEVVCHGSDEAGLAGAGRAVAASKLPRAGSSLSSATNTCARKKSTHQRTTTVSCSAPARAAARTLGREGACTYHLSTPWLLRRPTGARPSPRCSGPRRRRAPPATPAGEAPPPPPPGSSIMSKKGVRNGGDK
jgi:hypothetical protein